MSKEQKKIEAKEKRCPFGDLKCQDCRLFRQTAQGMSCLFEQLLGHLTDISLFQNMGE